jgi:hypothetical protein
MAINIISIAANIIAAAKTLRRSATARNANIGALAWHRE